MNNTHDSKKMCMGQHLAQDKCVDQDENENCNIVSSERKGSAKTTACADLWIKYSFEYSCRGQYYFRH